MPSLQNNFATKAFLLSVTAKARALCGTFDSADAGIVTVSFAKLTHGIGRNFKAIILAETVNMMINHTMRLHDLR